MAKITVSTEGLPLQIADIINDIFVPLVQQINPIVAEQLTPSHRNEKVRKKLYENLLDNAAWDVYGIEVAPGVFEIAVDGQGVSLNRLVDTKNKTLQHSFFELSYKMQGKGIAKHVMNASVKAADKLKINSIHLEANLDVGGYAWLRKGFFPADKKTLLGSMVSGGSLKEEFNSIVATMSDNELREYVLTEDFRRFKDLFLGSDWNGNIDLSNPISRTALTESANAAAYMVNRQIGPPSTANEKVLNDLVKHQTYLMRYAGSLRNDGTKLLQSTEERVRAVILRYSEDFEGLVPSSREAAKLYKAMAEEIAAIRAEAWDEIKDNVPVEMVSMGMLEQSATIAIIQGAFPVALGLQPLAADHIKRIVMAQPFEGRTLKEWLQHNQTIDAQRIAINAKNAMAAGQTPTEVARAAMGTKSLKYRDGHARKAFRDLEAVYLTVTNGIANQVKADLYAENSDIIKEVLFVATLDINTTVECAGHDGKHYLLAKAPQPPLHFRCRSLLVPYINVDNLRNRGFDQSNERMLLSDFSEQNGLGKIRKVDDLPRGYKTAYNTWSRKRKRELVGQVPATQNFDTWLRNQNTQFQNEYLGPGRAAIFRQGKLSLDKFVTRDGYELTIAELEKLSKAA